MWHVHLAMPQSYVNDCNSYFGVIMDHVQSNAQATQEARKLAVLFDATAKLWQKEFGEDYTAPNGPMPRCFRARTQHVASLPRRG